MKFHKRDYTKLTKKEIAEWNRLKRLEIVRGTGKLRVTRSRFHKYPKAARHFISLFPNHYLDVVELKKITQLNTKLNQFRALLDSPGVNERRILAMIRDNRAHFIIGSILKENFHFGHHDAFLFPEFPLGTSHRADYLLVGRSSDGYQFVFVELEAPIKNITITKGELGKAFRNGQTQINDWTSWLDANFQSLTEIFSKFKKAAVDLPDEFVRFDRTRVHFVIVAGRRGDFHEKTYRIRRSSVQAGGPWLLHYDNIVDSAQALIGKPTY